MNNTPSKMTGAGWFSLAWLIVNAAGWGVGFGLQILLIHNLGMGGLGILVGLLVAAVVVGLAQWLALRWLMPRLRSGSQGIAWVILTMFGFTAGFLIASMVSMYAGNAGGPLLLTLLMTFLAWVVIGLMTGLLQWMALQFSARGIWWWLGANALGYGLGAILLAQLSIRNTPVGYALAGLVAGAATLVALSRLRPSARA